MRGRLFAGRLYAGRQFGAQAAVDAPDDVIRHYGGGMNGGAPVVEVIRPRRIELPPRHDDDDDLLALVFAMATAISQ